MELAGQVVSARELDLIRVKRKSEPTRIYELLPEEKDTGDFELGLAAYRRRDWTEAETLFERCLAASPADPVPGVFLNRIRHLKDNDPGADWDGVWVFTTK